MQRNLTAKESEAAWIVLNYEIEVFSETSQILRQGLALSAADNLVTRGYVFGNLKNAVVESKLLHMRQLCEIFLSKGQEKDDIRLSDLFPDWDGEPERKNLTDRLRSWYGRRSCEGTPCWTFNKMLAHPTLQRGPCYSYEPVLANFEPIVRQMIILVRSLPLADTPVPTGLKP
jgi:hypothetical protein